jgi:hypothetical protein
MSRTPAALLAAALILGACSSDPEPKEAEPAAPSQTPSTASPTPTPTPTLPSLLAGRRGMPNGPILAVKIDNTASAHPQLGLTKADVVYVEQVEGGVTRLAAIYSSQRPRRVGPVRSARITDIELLRQYGTVGLIYSGAQRKLTPLLRRAKLGLVSNDASGRGFSRESSRPAPYNVIGDMEALLKRAGKISKPTKVGYEFGAAPPSGTPVRQATASFPSARVGATWSAKRKRWLMSMDGRPAMAAEGGRLAASTFVVQFATMQRSRFRDVNGANTPMTKTVGSGKALIFRDGKMYSGSWSRAKVTDPTTYRMAGKTAVFAPGTIWVALLGRGRPVRTS